MDNEQKIASFYSAFNDLNSDFMAKCYSSSIKFWDPAFGNLNGEEVSQMWTMLCKSQKGKNFKVHAHSIRSIGNTVRATWEADYEFGPKKRKVHNVIDAEFRFEDDLIVSHIDRFDLYRWSKMAMGITGTLIGWTSFFRKKLQAKTHHQLDKFMKEKPNFDSSKH